MVLASHSEAAADALMARTFALCESARAAGLVVTHAREIDVFRALKSIDCRNLDDYRVTLRTNLVSSRADEILFERVFRTYWGESEGRYEGDYILARSEMIYGNLDAGRSHEGHRDMLTEADSFGAEEVARRVNLALRWDADAPPLEQLIRELARRLATRPSRRQRPARLQRGTTCRPSCRAVELQNRRAAEPPSRRAAPPLCPTSRRSTLVKVDEGGVLFFNHKVLRCATEGTGMGPRRWSALPHAASSRSF